ncbi:MarR family transcriptional regulator [Pseudarthrobacter sp. NPDC080039]|uniref:MarR family transcriptional regulator n=1 Tax=unclassified Pseudarthrobacter TaxID=2647000 RepID=UPI0034507106
MEARRLTHHLSPILASEHLSLEEWLVLDALREKDGLSMSELAANTLASNATLSRHVDSLATRALVFREVAFEDRRRILVHLSKRGRALHETMASRLTHQERRLLTPQ